MKTDLLPGRYRHYKGKEYEVIDVARHSETEEAMVVYRTLYGEFDLWVRPLTMFVENVTVNNELLPRFRYLGAMQKANPPQSLDTTESSALLLIDAQVNMFDPQSPVYAAERMLNTLQALVAHARQTGMTIVHIQNNGGADDPDQTGSPGWEIHPQLQPQLAELVLQKFSDSAFATTSLHELLQQKGVKTLFLTGMQTDYCVDATTRHGLELGYVVIVIEDAHSTYDGSNQTASEVIDQYNEKFCKIASTLPASTFYNLQPILK